MKTQIDPRHQARRLAVQTLFEWSYHNEQTLIQRKETVVSNHETQIDEDPLSKHSFNQALYNSLVDGVGERLDELDQLISDCAPEWPLSQIARVDLSVLRVSAYEVIYFRDTPTKVAIDEAVELAKEFGGDNSSKFVNGVLGTIVKSKEIVDDTIKEEPTAPSID